jgi:transcriptional regulator with GAF, ATPase, and Fis domain
MLVPKKAVVDSRGDRAAWTITPAVDQADRREEIAGRGLRLVTFPGTLDVHRLTAEIAARLVAVTGDAIDGTIIECLGQLAEALQLESVILWRQEGNGTAAVASHSWLKHPSALPVDPLNLPSVSIVLPDGSATMRGGLAFTSSAPSEALRPAIVESLRLAAAVFGQALARKAALDSLQSAREELRRTRTGVTMESLKARSSICGLRGSRALVVESAPVQRALAQAECVAATPSTVLLLGETGVGKEVFAQAIHENSARRDRQMVRVSCAAIPSTLIESELFGYERGAFTGAVGRQAGRFEVANHSTLFLDEIGELSADVQVKLLRVLEERVIERLGSTTPIKIDVRIIAATHRNLEKAVADGTFREDLFYRLNVFPIVIPPLRERGEDLAALVWQFVSEFSAKLGKTIDSVSAESMRQLQRHQWPGNIRELRNVIERAVILSSGPQLTISIPQPAVGRQPQASMTLRELETEHIRATLKSTFGKIRGPGGAAERLGLKPTTLETRMAKLGVTRPSLGG